MGRILNATNMKLVCPAALWLVVLSVVCYLAAVSQAEECVMVDSCSCKTSTQTISLWPLSSRTSEPRFQANGNIPDVTYLYNPCRNFTIQTATGVVIQSVHGAPYILGDDSSATFSGDPHLGTMTLTYTHSDSYIQRKATFRLLCNTSTQGDLTFNGENPLVNYRFTLETSLVCLSEGVATPTPPMSTSLLVVWVTLPMAFLFLLVALVIVLKSICQVLCKKTTKTRTDDANDKVFLVENSNHGNETTDWI